jgi:hypothetical protein
MQIGKRKLTEFEMATERRLLVKAILPAKSLVALERNSVANLMPCRVLLVEYIMH